MICGLLLGNSDIQNPFPFRLVLDVRLLGVPTKPHESELLVFYGRRLFLGRLAFLDALADHGLLAR